MLIVVSPAKTLKTDLSARENSTRPTFLSQSEKLATELKKYKPAELSNLMDISANLAQLNHGRYQLWKSHYSDKESLNAIFAFRGEVFNGIDIDDFTEEELIYAQNHLRILSGLYGVLRPMDAILPYRLEMGTKLQLSETNNLYQFWGNQITKAINIDLKNQKEEILVNLASEEYFRSINKKLLKAKIITPVFKENKNGTYKIISVYAKKARGMMTRFILKNRINSIEDLKHFCKDKYYYNDTLSTENQIVFTR